MAAIVDLANGRVLPPPFNRGPGHSYFQVLWAFPRSPALSYRLDSRLLIANICETEKVCGVYYFVVGERGLKLIRRELE
jgi:hypothetical protein